MDNKQNKSSLSCIILAGGEGKRLHHQDKGLVDFNGSPLITHIIDSITSDSITSESIKPESITLESVKSRVDDIVISANRNTEEYKKYSDKVIKDDIEGYQGPLAGIASCLPHCQHEWILVVPCDIPFLPDDLIEKLIENLNAADSKLAVAKAHHQRQLVFLMHSSLTENLNTFLEQGHKKAMTWIELQNPSVVMFDSDGGNFLNVNTTEDLQLL